MRAVAAGTFLGCLTGSLSLFPVSLVSLASLVSLVFRSSSNQPTPPLPSTLPPHTPPNPNQTKPNQPTQTLLDEGDKPRAADLSELLYETSLLTSGFALDAPRDYANKVFTLMKIALGGDGGAMGAGAGAGAAGAAGGEAQEGASAAAPVEAEVVPGDGGDPWGKK